EVLDSFWESHAAINPAGDMRDPEQLSADTLVDMAADLDMDTDDLADDMHSHTVAPHTQANQQLGMDIGAYSTPAFVLNGEPLLGAQPTDVFVDAVDDALATAQD